MSNKFNIFWWNSQFIVQYMRCVITDRLNNIVGKAEIVARRDFAEIEQNYHAFCVACNFCARYIHPSFERNLILIVFQRAYTKGLAGYLFY